MSAFFAYKRLFSVNAQASHVSGRDYNWTCNCHQAPTTIHCHRLAQQLWAALSARVNARSSLQAHERPPGSLNSSSASKSCSPKPPTPYLLYHHRGHLPLWIRPPSPSNSQIKISKNVTAYHCSVLDIERNTITGVSKNFTSRNIFISS